MYNDELYHFGVKGMRWGHRKKYQKVARSLGGSRFAKKAIINSKYLNNDGKKEALNEQAYLSAEKKAKKTGGTIKYDVTTGTYSVSKGQTKKSYDPVIKDKTNKKIFGNFTTGDAVKTAGRFIGGVTMETIGTLAATKTGKDYLRKIGESGNYILSTYNGYVVTKKGIVPAINNRRNKKAAIKRGSSGELSIEEHQEDIRRFMDNGTRFTQQCLQQNNMVATNQIMGFY